jgi:hypothetical protein
LSEKPQRSKQLQVISKSSTGGVAFSHRGEQKQIQYGLLLLLFL